MKVVLGFADSSLGGTSRSALLYARMWRSAGADVLVYSPTALHERRALDAARDGLHITSSLPEVRAFGAAFAHVHHAAPSVETVDWVRRLSTVLPAEAVVLTHNVFGQPLPVDLGERVVVGVLGHWVGAQYRLQTGRSSASVRVLPNPQDFAFFRPPTAVERRTARAELGIDAGERVILRVGSPNEAKWSRSGYAALVHAVREDSSTVVRLIGAPHSFHLDGPGVTVRHEPVDDTALRREYWAADVFAHWAERGESFGNVILESLGAGLPVVYRAVPTRDNTPAEFRGLRSFEYVTNARSWLDRVRRRRTPGVPDSDVLEQRYGSAAVEARLRGLVAGFGGNPDALLDLTLGTFESVRPLRASELLAVGVRHNPVAAALKRRRLQRTM